MKIDLNKSEFLNGGVSIKVSSNEQSQFLINLSKENGFDVGNDIDIFEIDTWIHYPYYFIEDNWQLQACDSETNTYCDCEELVNFEDWFELERENESE